LDNWQYKKYFSKEQLEIISRQNILPLPPIDEEMLAALNIIESKVNTRRFLLIKAVETF
jgi:hypothetical protein